MSELLERAGSPHISTHPKPQLQIEILLARRRQVPAHSPWTRPHGRMVFGRLGRTTRASGREARAAGLPWGKAARTPAGGFESSAPAVCGARKATVAASRSPYRVHRWQGVGNRPRRAVSVPYSHIPQQIFASGADATHGNDFRMLLLGCRSGQDSPSLFGSAPASQPRPNNYVCSDCAMTSRSVHGPCAKVSDTQAVPQGLSMTKRQEPSV